MNVGVDQATRDVDTVARFGGDEFAVLLEVPCGPGVAQAVAKRMARAFEQPFTLATDQIRLGASIGVAIADAALTSAELIRRADAAMYRAKAGAKVAVFPD